MADTSEREYFLSRAQAAREMAERASNSEARDIHLRMAKDYDLLAANVGEEVGTRVQQTVLNASINTSRDAIRHSSEVLRQTARMAQPEA